MYSSVLPMMRTLVVACLLAWFALPVRAQSSDVKRTVSVSGEGVVHVEPDMATLRFGVVTTADQPEKARSENAEAAKNALNAVRALGIEEKDIKLESLRLQPKREWIEDTRRYEENGYEAARDVVVKVRDLDKLPDLVAKVVQEGANRLNDVTYDVEDRSEARAQAMTEAVKNAQAKAKLLVEALGESLGSVQNISEQSFDFPQPVFRAEAMMSKDQAGGEPEAYAAGEIDVRVTVQTVFAIE